MDRYSRLVNILKVLLPLVALAILATLFLISRGMDLDAVLPFAEDELAERTRDQQITGPFFSGTTSGGDEIIVSATLARPGGPSRPSEATEVSARMTRADGAHMTLESDLVTVDIPQDRAVFSGGVEIVTSTGLHIETDKLETALQGVSGSTSGRVTGNSPFGDLDAGRMSFAAENGNGPLHMVFKDGVKLLYRPESAE